MKAGSSLAGRTARNTLALSLIVLAAAVWAAGWAPAARAGGPGVWTPISADVTSALVQPALARGPFGVLQVVWIKQWGPQDLFYLPVSADGSPGTRQTLASAWNSLSNPDVVVGVSDMNDIRVFAGGQDAGAVHDGLEWWRSTDGGASFGPQAQIDPAEAYAGGGVSAVQTPAGYFQTWPNPGESVHKGLSSGGVYDYNDLGAGVSTYNSVLGYASGTGDLYVVAAFLGGGKDGLWARHVDQSSGAPAGSSYKLPGSTKGTDFAFCNMRTPIAGLRLGDVLVAYPTGYPTTHTLSVWRLGPSSAATPSIVATSPGAISEAGLAADAFGRAWVVWTTQSSGRSTVYARRSNPGASKWGATVKIQGPSGTATLCRLTANAQDDRVDVVGTFQKGGQYVLYHTQVWAGLSVAVSPKAIHAGKAAKVTVTVTDAGQPLAGAKVKLGAASATTDLAGKAKFSVKLAKKGKLAVTVTKPGYVGASTSISIVH